VAVHREGKPKMQVEFLGTGGAITIPQPGCDCRVCVDARREGVPCSRSGPSLFVHGPDVLIDTPEEIKDQLNRSGVERIAAGFYSHWHPDHTMGRRLWEMNKDWRGWPRRNRCTDIYLPEPVARDFRARLGLWQHLTFLQDQGLVRLIEIEPGDSVELNGWTIRPLPLAFDYVFAFWFEGEGKRLLIVPDELKGWEPPGLVRNADLAVLPMGVVEFDPFNGERRIEIDHPVLKSEATFRETLEIAAGLDARRTVLTHIEEPDGLGFDDLQRLEAELPARGWNVTFAYDTLRLDV
jgi:phosphoribosyl 1,2-cyclic phosphate phosphodiesterase